MLTIYWYTSKIGFVDFIKLKNKECFILKLLQITNKNSGNEFEAEWGGVYGNVWKEKREGRNVLIKL